MSHELHWLQAQLGILFSHSQLLPFSSLFYHLIFYWQKKKVKLKIGFCCFFWPQHSLAADFTLPFFSFLKILFYLESSTPPLFAQKVSLLLLASLAAPCWDSHRWQGVPVLHLLPFPLLSPAPLLYVHPFCIQAQCWKYFYLSPIISFPAERVSETWHCNSVKPFCVPCSILHKSPEIFPAGL